MFIISGEIKGMSDLIKKLKSVNLQMLAAGADYINRCEQALQKFFSKFGANADIALVSAPGCINLAGGYPESQNGCALMASVNRDILCVAAENKTDEIYIFEESSGKHVLKLADLTCREEEHAVVSHTKIVLNGLIKKGLDVAGFNAYITADFDVEAGFSYWAAFEMLVAGLVNDFFNKGKLSKAELAGAANETGGLHSFMQERLASSHGGINYIDFRKRGKPKTRQIKAGLPGYSLVKIATKKGDKTEPFFGSDTLFDRTQVIADRFGKPVLREVDQHEFFEQVPEIRQETGDSTALLAMYFFEQLRRTKQQVAALEILDLERFFGMVKKSGNIALLLKQIQTADAEETSIFISNLLAIVLCENILEGKGAFMLHEDSTSSNIIVFVPNEMLDLFCSYMRSTLGHDSLSEIALRAEGVARLI